MKPSWDDAPPWAQFLALDGDGMWWWFQLEPEYDAVIKQWNAPGSVAIGYVPIDPEYTLEPRP